MRRLVVVAALSLLLVPGTARAGTPPGSVIRFSHPLLAPGTPQTVTVFARDLDGLPLRGARVLLVLHLATRTSHIHMKPTNALGVTAVVIHPSLALKGTRVGVSATISTPSMTVPVTSSFLISRSAVSSGSATGTPAPAPSPTRGPARTPSPTATRVAPTGSIVVTARAVPPTATAPGPIWIVVDVHSAAGQVMPGVPVQAVASFGEGVVQASGTTDTGGVATLRVDTTIARASQSVHITASATWKGQTVFGSTDVALTVPAQPTPTPAPSQIPTVPAPTATIPPTLTAPIITDTPAPTAAPFPTDTATPIPTDTPVPTATLPTTCNGQSCMDAMLQIINNTRAQYGLSPYSLDLTQSNGTATCVGSIGHSEAMQQSGSIWHVNPAYPAASFPNNNCYYGGINSPPVGQNVGVMSNGSEMNDLIGIHNLMMSEPHDAATCATSINHACALLSTTYHRVGLGILFVNGVTWLTEDFIG